MGGKNIYIYSKTCGMLHTKHLTMATSGDQGEIDQGEDGSQRGFSFTFNIFTFFYKEKVLV